MEMYRSQNGEVEHRTQKIAADRPRSFDHVSPAQSASCSQCKSVYDAICGGPGCRVGYATICYLVSGALGAAWCSAVVGDICDFLDDNSCEVGTNEAVCQILGYCSTSSGTDPCEEYDFDDNHCDSG